MNSERHLTLRRDGIDTTGLAMFLSEALDLMRHRDDLVDICGLLAIRVTEILPVDTAGVVIADDVIGLRLAAMSRHSEAARQLIESQFSNGPVSACLLTREMITQPDVRSTGTGADFVSLCTSSGVTSAYCLPIKSHETIFGILSLLSGTRLSDDDLAVAGILADVAAVAFLQGDARYAPATARIRTTELLGALDTIEQAKGMLGQRYGTTVDLAYDGLWRVSLDHNIGLARLAEQVVNRTLDEAMTTALSSQFSHPGSVPTE